LDRAFARGVRGGRRLAAAGSYFPTEADNIFIAAAAAANIDSEPLDLLVEGRKRK